MIKTPTNKTPTNKTPTNNNDNRMLDGNNKDDRMLDDNDDGMLDDRILNKNGKLNNAKLRKFDSFCYSSY